MSDPDQTPRFGTLAIVTYSIVFVTLGLSVGAYYYMSREARSRNAVQLEDTRTVQVGAVWVPAYPGAALHNKVSNPHGETVEGSLDFQSADPAAKVVSFFDDTMKRMGYLTTVVTNNVGGGTVQAYRHGGRSRASITVEASRDGSQGRITTLYRAEKQ